MEHFILGALLGALALTGNAKGQEASSTTLPVSPPLLSSLPWDDLKAKLVGPSTVLVVDATPSDYVDECLPEFELDESNRTNHNLIDQPSGVCMVWFFCGFERCNPIFAGESSVTVREQWEKFDSPDVEEWLDPGNPSYNIPSKVLFPQVAGDVYAAVTFAKQHKIQISVKNSGHSYAGASTKKDTLHLNMNHFNRYSDTANGLVECGTGSELQEDINPDLGNQPCQLALARNKPATLRVGGGENFDKVYRAVKTWNEAQSDGYKYHLVGGAAGTVSPMGWTWQGGLSATMDGRNNGFGVDQVLQVEMVLPLGPHHVRFGPTGWEDAEGYQHPRTTEVSGVCNEKPYEDENSWVWSACPDNIDFEELWFAVNGGGGGTYGIVVSVHLQLHDYVFPASNVLFGNGVLAVPPCDLSVEDAFGPLGDATWSFLIDFLLNPGALGVSENISNSCAGLPHVPFTASVWCYGDGVIEAMLGSWRSFLAQRNQTLLESGVPSSSIETAAVCFNDAVKKYRDYPESILIPDGPHAGKARDDPKPAYLSDTEKRANVLLPKTWMLENKDQVIALLNPKVGVLENKDQVIALLNNGTVSYWAFGGNTATAQDQSNSLSDAHREAGLMVVFPLEMLDESFYRDTFPQMYDVTGDNFPGFIGSNHAGPNTRGPLKDDWSKPCSLDWTQEERDEKCISLQESIWGTEKLARLEAVKDAIDPNRMLDCYSCVGNNRPAAAETMSTDDSDASHSAAVTLTTSVFIGSLSLFYICYLF